MGKAVMDKVCCQSQNSSHRQEKMANTALVGTPAKAKACWVDGGKNDEKEICFMKLSCLEKRNNKLALQETLLE